MLSRRALTFLALSSASIVLLLLALGSSGIGIGRWSLDDTGYQHLFSGHKSPSGNSSDATTTLPDHPDQGQEQDGPSAAHHAVDAKDQPFRPPDPICDNFPDTSNILLVMKTGATESHERVPTQLMTMLKCLPEFFIFSDLDEDIGGYRIRDSLDNILNTTMDGNRDFDLYRRQQECAVDQQSCNKLAMNDKEGWQLDKYKNVHMAEKVWELRPGYDWYLFVDADTYVLFPTLVQWLRTLDPSEKHYLGSLAMLRGYPFGHGGSGYIVSRPVMEGFGKHLGIANELEPVMRKECCGDYVFGVSVENTTGARVENMWPTINGEKPFTLPYGPSHWCNPIVTMHHLNSEEISSFWSFETSLYRHQAESSLGREPAPVRIKDVYHAFMAPELVPVRHDWDNLSEDRFYLKQVPGGRQFSGHELNRAKTENLSEKEIKAHESFEACREVCEQVKKCFQFRWQDGLCGLSWSFKMGAPRKRGKGDGEEKRFKSGWSYSKIQSFIEEEGDCGEVEWPKAS